MAREGQDGEITKEVARSFPTKLRIRIHTPSDGHALGYIMKTCEHKIDELELDGNRASFLSFLNEVKGTEGPIGKLILETLLSDASDDPFDAAIAVLPKITDELRMRHWLTSQSEDSIIHWMGKFQQKLNALDSDKNPNVVFKDRVDMMTYRDNLNYDELVEKLRQHYQVEEDRFGKEVSEEYEDVWKYGEEYIYITLTRDRQPTVTSK